MSAISNETGYECWLRYKKVDNSNLLTEYRRWCTHADSEYNPGPSQYGRSQADGANMLAEALEPFGGIVIWRCYDTHFEGVEQAIKLKEKWISLKGKIDAQRFDHVLKRLEMQIEHAKEWRDVINTYFHRMTGIDDENGRKIYR